MNNEGEILVVQERSGTTKSMNFWKMCTGQLEVGEEISEAAERELFEETGIKANFESLLCFWHVHNYLHGKGDIFFVCLLKLPEAEQA